MDWTILLSLNTIEEQHSNPTYNTEAAITQFLYYASTNPSAIFQYKSSIMILHIFSDSLHLSEPWTPSLTGENYYLRLLSSDPSKDPNLPAPKNVPIHTECRILNHVVASASKSEDGGLFYNGQTAVPLRIALHEICFPLPPTPIKTDDSEAKGIVPDTVRQKTSKVMEMKFYWMKDRVKLKDLFIYWKPGSKNMGGYFTKNHPPHNHK